MPACDWSIQNEHHQKRFLSQFHPRFTELENIHQFLIYDYATLYLFPGEDSKGSSNILYCFLNISSEILKHIDLENCSGSSYRGFTHLAGRSYHEITQKKDSFHEFTPEFYVFHASRLKVISRIYTDIFWFSRNHADLGRASYMFLLLVYRLTTWFLRHTVSVSG